MSGLELEVARLQEKIEALSAENNRLRIEHGKIERLQRKIGVLAESILEYQLELKELRSPVEVTEGDP